MPRTVLSLVTRVGWTRYATNPSLEAIPVRVVAELTSPITRWLEGSLAIGYGGSLALRGLSLQVIELLGQPGFGEHRLRTQVFG